MSLALFNFWPKRSDIYFNLDSCSNEQKVRIHCNKKLGKGGPNVKHLSSDVTSNEAKVVADSTIKFTINHKPTSISRLFLQCYSSLTRVDTTYAILSYMIFIHPLDSWRCVRLANTRLDMITKRKPYLGDFHPMINIFSFSHSLNNINIF